MITIGISTATATTEICVLEDQKILYKKSWNSNFDEAEKTLPALEKALSKIKDKKIDQVIAVAGPGSFTGLRIGVTIANTLAFSSGAKTYYIDTFDLLKAKIPHGKEEKTAVIIRAGGDFCMINSADGSSKKLLIKDLKTLPMESFYKCAIADLSSSEKRKYKLCDGIEWITKSEQLPFAEALLRIINSKALKQTKNNIIVPIYLDPPKITVSKKQCLTK